jgi:hypothetical protein
VVGRGAHPALRECIGQLLGAPRRGDIDDARLRRRDDPLEQRLVRAFRVGEQLDREADVRSVLGLAQAKPSWDLLAHGRCSSRWVRKHHRTPELLDDGAQMQVVGAEIVAPLVYAVRLVHHGQGRSRGANALEHVLLAELLGRHEHGFELASRRSSSDSSRSPRATVEESCAASLAASRSTSDSTWSRCRAASGETTTAGPSMSSPAI